MCVCESHGWLGKLVWGDTTQSVVPVVRERPCEYVRVEFSRQRSLWICCPKEYPLSREGKELRQWGWEVENEIRKVAGTRPCASVGLIRSLGCVSNVDGMFIMRHQLPRLENTSAISFTFPFQMYHPWGFILHTVWIQKGKDPAFTIDNGTAPHKECSRLIFYNSFLGLSSGSWTSHTAGGRSRLLG